MEIGNVGCINIHGPDSIFVGETHATLRRKTFFRVIDKMGTHAGIAMGMVAGWNQSIIQK